MNRRQLFAVAALAGAAITASTAARAFDWNWGTERIKGSGEISTENRDVGAFDGIALVGGFKVQIRQADSHKVEIKADKNLLPYLETRVVESGKGRVLEVGPKKGVSFSSTTTPELSLTMAQLRSIRIAGSGLVKVEAMKTGALEAGISGSGDVRFEDLTSEKLSLSVSGSGDVVAKGRTGMMSVSIAGSGDVKVAELVADEVKVSIAGSGDARVNAQKKLNVSIAGSGDVSYVGSPEISSSVAGSGKVRKMNP
ncbi:head GIN domain-containing protein [Pelomonas sp. SE-A7]|uniref:head GIN domain-containing protein n=1 Tax=Pelomonas sp. SE-A7 TaxID=3054953 RepID=UPI00259CD2BE|nr:head GIN domain-containing protein [Pelomonas sp. SE-A7]MDM4766739.1 head GIN domain-containing protein [Pelomonas sp. SE-A7]